MTTLCQTTNKKLFTPDLIKKAISYFTPSKISRFFEPKLKQLENELQLLSTYSTDTIYRLRYKNMHYDYISPSIQKLLGFSTKEFKKLDIRSLIQETKIVTKNMETVTSYKALEQARKEGNMGKWQADYHIQKKDGTTIWVTDISHPWYDEHGNIIGSIGSLRDISDRINAENKVKEEIVRLSYTDALTGIANRKEFFKNINTELKRVKRSNNHFSVLLIDIDHFKKINENYGHHIGDDVLTQIANILKSCLRETDVAARIGGEEFGIFLPDTTENSAFWVADRIRHRIAEHSFPVPDNKTPLKCTVSIGIASTQNSLNLTETTLYKEADIRLYIAKNTGRNQVSMDEIIQVH